MYKICSNLFIANKTAFKILSVVFLLTYEGYNFHDFYAYSISILFSGFFNLTNLPNCIYNCKNKIKIYF